MYGSQGGSGKGLSRWECGDDDLEGEEVAGGRKKCASLSFFSFLPEFSSETFEF